jgi:uncharacterized protein (TIGR00369 family)
MAADESNAPAGFEHREMAGRFGNHSARFYAKWEHERLVLGFRISDRHVNVDGICHGGMLATFADTLLGCGTMYQALGGRHNLATVSLQIEFMTAARIGQWVQGSVDVLKRTRSMAFVRGLVEVDGDPAMSLSAVFKIGAPADPLDPDFFRVKHRKAA